MSGPEGGLLVAKATAWESDDFRLVVMFDIDELRVVEKACFTFRRQPSWWQRLRETFGL